MSPDLVHTSLNQLWGLRASAIQQRLYKMNPEDLMRLVVTAKELESQTHGIVTRRVSASQEVFNDSLETTVCVICGTTNCLTKACQIM